MMMADLPAWVAFGTSVITGLTQVATTKISTAARTAVAEVENRLTPLIAAAQKRADDAYAAVESLKQAELVRTAARSQPTQPTMPDAEDLGAILGMEDIRRRLLQLEDGERERQADATRLAGEIGRLVGRIEAMSSMAGGSRR